MDQALFDKYINGADFIINGQQEIKYFLTNKYIYMVLMTFLMGNKRSNII